MAQGCEAFGRPLTASLFPCKTGSKISHKNAEGIASVGTEEKRTVKGQMRWPGPHETSGHGFTEWPSVCVCSSPASPSAPGLQEKLEAWAKP